MATSNRKRNLKTKAPFVSKKQKKRPVIRQKNNRRSGKLRNYFLPGVISLCILIGIGFLVTLGYRTVTASGFFDVKRVDVRGTNRSSKSDIEKIVSTQTERSGVWNADLIDLKGKLEKLTFVKSVTVSRVLPNGIRVNVIEREPEAIVSLSSGDYLIDGDGEIIAAAKKGEDQMPVVLRGWDESKTEKASKDNLQRIKLYQKMMSDWSEFQLIKRVKEINLSDLQEPKAMIEDSGSNISVALSRDNFGKSLKAALEAVAGKGEKIKSVDSAGVYPIIEYLNF